VIDSHRRSTGRREFLISKGWIQAVVLVVLFGFFVLGLLAYRNYTSHPAVPKRVVTPGGATLFTALGLPIFTILAVVMTVGLTVLGVRRAALGESAFQSAS
jgi:nitric oxide reductase large subunit